MNKVFINFTALYKVPDEHLPSWDLEHLVIQETSTGKCAKALKAEAVIINVVEVVKGI